jgi:hypothetical protein
MARTPLDVLHVILRFRFFLLAAWEVSDFLQGELRGFDPLYWWSFCLFQQQPASRPSRSSAFCGSAGTIATILPNLK